MNTSLALVALMGLMPTRASVDGPTWLNDYGQARKVGQELRKPLAVIVGSGAQGYDQLSGNGKLPPEARRLLADNYVCVYVDTATERGRQFAANLAIQTTGLVVSDRSGAYQAFHFRGTLSDDELARNLKRFADPNHVVRDTVTSPAGERVSYYPTQSGGSSPWSQPTYPSYPSFAPSIPAGGFGSGRNC